VYLPNPNFANPNFANPNFANPNFANPNFANPNFANPNFANPNFANPYRAHALGCPCPGELRKGDDPVDVPEHLARPAVPPLQGRRVGRKMDGVEIHIIDVVDPLLDPNDPLGPPPGDPRTGELRREDNPIGSYIDENGDRFCDPALAHGTFIASIIANTSGVASTLWSAMGPLGDIDDVWLVRALDRVDQEATGSKKVLNLSLGGYNEDDKPSPILAKKIENMVQRDWLIVASAGNSRSCRPMWPAALPDVIAVGAIDRFDQPAWFTNYGGWVDACALGVEVVAEYPNGNQLANPPLLISEDPKLTTDEFNTGWATWDGSSFAAPLVAGRLALRWEHRTKEQAVDLLIKDGARRRIPGLGTIVR
jgi:subtilisin family serine protease